MQFYRSLLFVIVLLFTTVQPVLAEDLGLLTVSLPTAAQASSVSTPTDSPAPITPTEQYFPTPQQLQNWQWPNHPYHLPSVLPVRGQSMYYNPGVMQKVIKYRYGTREITPCPECIGYVALMRSGDINRRVWLQMRDGRVEGPFLVTDVAARHDIPRLLSLGWAVDVDWETAQRWGWRMPLVTVLDAPPPGWTQTLMAVSDQQLASSNAVN